MRIVVTGWREADERHGPRMRAVFEAIEVARHTDLWWLVVPTETGPTLMVSVAHGGAPGVDSLVSSTVPETWAVAPPFMAEWDTYGKAAGPLRNERMLVEFKPHLVVGFPGINSVGTRDCLERARFARIPTWEFPLGEFN